MKNKNLLLVLAAIVFATGSAFTTKKVLVNNVRVRWQQDDYGVITCRAIPLECNEWGYEPCRVVIIKDTGSEAVLAKTDTDCAVRRYHYGFVLGPYQAVNPPFDVFSE
jgi:hypothetical protein